MIIIFIFSHVKYINFSNINFIQSIFSCISLLCLSYDIASVSEITPCNKICKPLVIYRFSGHVMTSTPTLRA